MKTIQSLTIVLSLACISSLSLAQDDCLLRFEEMGVPHSQQAGDTQNIICRKGYALSYNEKTKISDWVIERLNKDRLLGSATRKKSKFREDKSLTPAKSATLKDYRKSGYDRGHMAPAADMKWHQVAMDESFYLSNMAPQVGIGFNRGIWRVLEEDVRDLARIYDELYVITGPVFINYSPTIGTGKIVVPDLFYKIIYDPKRMKAIGFLLPNISLKNKNYSAYIVSIREIENKTGFNFLNSLPIKLQNKIEMTPSKMWQKETLLSYQ